MDIGKELGTEIVVPLPVETPQRKEQPAPQPQKEVPVEHETA